MADMILLRRPRNVSFRVLGLPTHWRCAVCGVPNGPDETDMRCERCATVMHWDCYWDRVAGAPEHRQMLHADTDDDIEGLIILCLGCRS